MDTPKDFGKRKRRRPCVTRSIDAAIREELFVYFRRIYLYPRREAGRVIFAYVVRIRATSLLKHPCWLCWRESLKIDSSEHG